MFKVCIHLLIDNDVLQGIPQQTNNHDCGVYAACFAYYRTSMQQQLFQPSDIPTIRERMKLSLSSSEFLSPLASDNDVGPPVVNDVVLPTHVKRKSNNVCASSVKKKPKLNTGTLKIPKFSKKVEGNKVTSTDGAYLITSAHVHLRSHYFKESEGQHSLFVYCYTIVLALLNSNKLSSECLDNAIFGAHQQFVDFGGEGLVFPSQIVVKGKIVTVEFQLILTDKFFAVNRAAILSKHLDDVTIDDNHGFVFIGRGRSVCFWPIDNRKYFLFNCHCVDVNNSVVTSVRAGAARLFQCMSSSSLSTLIFQTHIHDIEEYNVYRVNLNGL